MTVGRAKYVCGCHGAIHEAFCFVAWQQMADARQLQERQAMTADRTAALAAAQIEVIKRLRERNQLRYMGDCKCGQCQLVPVELICAAADLIELASIHAISTAKEADRMREALEPSGETKAAYSGEFKFKSQAGRVEYVVPWTTVKEIMAAIRARAALLPSEGTKG